MEQDGVLVTKTAFCPSLYTCDVHNTKDAALKAVVGPSLLLPQFNCFLTFDTQAASDSLTSRMESNVQDPEDGQLLEVEVFWRDHQPWLKERGYLLRPRYQVDWKASWVRNKRLRYLDCEDGIVMGVRNRSSFEIPSLMHLLVSKYARRDTDR